MSRSRLSWVWGIVFGIASCSVAAQGFVNVTSTQGIHAVLANTFNGAGMSFADFNNDGWDDLSFATVNSPLKFYQNNQGSYQEVPAFVPLTGHIKAIIWVDYDNDGDKDLFLTRYENTSKLFRNNGNMQFEDISEDAGIPQDFTALTYGASFGDYDRDGWLDLYICNFNRPEPPSNWLLHNNGDGTFTDVSQLSGTHNEFRNSFQSTFLDVNHDLWPDIFVINDKTTQNTLYLNHGEEGFENVTYSAGFSQWMESMSNSLSDYDHDGDLDIYITNTMGGNALYRNNGDTTFTDIGAQNGLQFNSVCWGALWCDFDNNGWDDLYVLDANPFQTDRNKFYRNNQGNSFDNFIPQGMFNDLFSSYSNTMGDMNNDGYPDIAVTNHAPAPAVVWQNLGGLNTYLKVDLQGTISNRDGIGAWVNIYTGDLEQHKYTVCGDNYLGQNSQRLIFGLGTENTIDSLIVEWPSGLVDKWFGLSANQTIHALEGETIQNSLLVGGALQLCSGDSLFMAVSLEGTTVWNDGYQGSARYIQQSGTYSATTTVSGFVVATNTLTVEFETAPELQVAISNALCFGEANGELTVLNATDYEQIGWESGTFGASVQQLSAGTYSVVARTEGGCQTSNYFTVEEPTVLSSAMEGPAILCSGDLATVSIEASGGVAPYTLSENWLWESLLPAGDYECVVTDANGCTSSSSVAITEPEQLISSLQLDGQTGMLQAVVSGGEPSYTYLWSSGESTATILPAEWGLVSCVIEDANNCSTQAEANYQWVSVSGLDEVPTVIFPNPGNTHFQVVSSRKMHSIFLFDAAGRLLLESSDLLTNGVNTSHLSTGWYFVRCVDYEGKVHTISWQKVME